MFIWAIALVIFLVVSGLLALQKALCQQRQPASSQQPQQGQHESPHERREWARHEQRQQRERQRQQLRQQMINLDQNDQAVPPIHPPSNFVFDNATSRVPANLSQLIPTGTIVKSTDGRLLAADFGSEDFTLLDDDHCVICLEEWEHEQVICSSKKCSHVFHSACLLSWAQQGNRECPTCRQPFLPEGCAWDVETSGTNATTNFTTSTTPLQDMASVAIQRGIFPSFLPAEQRREYLEDLLHSGTVRTAGSVLLEVSFADASPLDCESLPTRTCLICSEGWSEGAALIQSSNPSCCHYFHRECILDHLLFTSLDCPLCHQAFVSATGNYVSQ